MKKLSVHYGSFSLMALFFLSSCASYTFSNKQQGESVQITIKEQQDVLAINDLKPQVVAINSARGVLVMEGVNMAVNGIKMLIQNEQNKYTANYRTALSDIYYYNFISEQGPFDFTGIKFSGFDILRQVQLKDGTIDTAVYISFVLDLDNPEDIINNSVFHLKVEDFVMKYCKAKIPGFRWYLPWTAFFAKRKYVNVDMDISFSSSWVNDRSQIFRDEEIGRFFFDLRNVPVDYHSKEYQDYAQNVIGRKLYGFSYLVPRSNGNYVTYQNEIKNCYGKGQYNISAEITETAKDNFVSRVMSQNKDYIMENVKYELINKLNIH
ncbi:MAG: hypothetical protein ISR55_07130 [Bacteroidetes bacterium]|nr:hypothetical protein [Bacteroidota bacterium]